MQIVGIEKFDGKIPSSQSEERSEKKVDRKSVYMGEFTMKLDESMKKEINEQMEKIQAPSSLYQFAKNIKEESEINSGFEKTKGTKRGWKKTQFAVAVVISLGVLAGSAYLNPTMAEMVSKIPYLGQVFQRPILEAIRKH